MSNFVNAKIQAFYLMESLLESLGLFVTSMGQLQNQLANVGFLQKNIGEKIIHLSRLPML
jgi:uncharacterized protein Smg (DUF494 family)